MKFSRRFRAILWLSCLLWLAQGCKRGTDPASAPISKPSLRLYALSTLAGALEPCGCVSDMLGGLDHAAALLDAGGSEAGGSLLVAAGPLFFEDPEIEARARVQARWKAGAIAASLRAMKLVAWAPGANDWADGAAGFRELKEQAGAVAVAANLRAAGEPFAATRVIQAGGYRVGIAGISEPKHDRGAPDAVAMSDVEAAARDALGALKKEGAPIRLLLAAIGRGEALRLVERVQGFHLMVLGKPYDRGQVNDEPIPAVRVGETLVIQAPNHGQGIAVVDLFVEDGDFRFADGTGLEALERRASLERRIERLERRIAAAASNGAKQSDIDARRSDVAELRDDLGSLREPVAPRDGSFFRYRLIPVRESAGRDASVAARFQSYYRRVNEHNKKAFADHAPPEPGPGQSRYVGSAACGGCHIEALAFWDQTRHATAYASLSEQHKEYNLDCVGCHVTGYEKPGGSTVTFVDKLKSVQCEVCHGPGSRHIGDPADKALMVLAPERTSCASECHHPPHVHDDWNVGEAWKKIIGPGHGR
jgi:2',3'-cyclic-nucleotide 2'-phosphodiesterase (5'-nucleotidase family)